MKRIFIIFAVTLLMIMNLMAIGESGGSIFNFNAGARAASMAGVFIAKADDVNTIFYNPAGMVNIGSYELGFTYDKNIADIRNAIVTFVAPIQEIGSIGIGIIHSTIQRDINNSIEGEAIKVYDLAGILGYSYAITKELLIGGNIKYLNSQLGEYSSWAMGIDIGVLYYLNKNISLGLVGQNIGTGIKFDSEETKLPIKVGLGANYEAINIEGHTVTIGSDIRYNFVDNYMETGIGVEYLYNEMFGIRLGYMLEANSLNGLTAGAGVKSVVDDMVLRFDYAFLPKLWQEGDFDSSHMISFSVAF